MKSKYTPGPWIVKYAQKSTNLPYEIFAEDSPEFRLRPLACVDSNGENGEHYCGNAMLIASAPLMLMHLKNYLTFLKIEWGKNAPFNTQFDDCRMKDIKNLIAKIEGETV